MGNEFCMLDVNDGDPNFTAKDHMEKGWGRKCINISEFRVQNLEISSFKEGLKIEKI